MIASDFSSTLRYHERAEPATLLADLQALRVRAEWARSGRRWWIAGLVGWIAACGLFGLGMGDGAWCFVGVLFAVPGVILAGVRISHLGKQILDERRRRHAVSLVHALGCDLEPDGKIELDVNFRPYNNEAQYGIPKGTAGRYSLTSYRQPWLTASAKLADGTAVELATELIVHRKERAKTKGRKKIKEDMHEQIVLTVRVPSLPPSAAQRWPDLMRTSRLSHQTYVHRAEVKEGRLSAVVRTKRALRITNKGAVELGSDAETKLAGKDCLLTPMLAAYQALAACRKET